MSKLRSFCYDPSRQFEKHYEKTAQTTIKPKSLGKKKKTKMKKKNNNFS